MLSQLYAAIQEWRTGNHRAVKFSCNSYLDVYQGNVNTLQHIVNNRGDAFHVMMADIYSQARLVLSRAIMIYMLISCHSTKVAGSSSATIATLDLDEIEG